MYIEGRGVEQDKAIGYMWLLLSEETAKEVIGDCRELSKQTAAQLDKGQIEQAKQEALKRWQSNHPGDGPIPESFWPDAAVAPADEPASVAAFDKKAG